MNKHPTREAAAKSSAAANADLRLRLERLRARFAAQGRANAVSELDAAIADVAAHGRR